MSLSTLKNGTIRTTSGKVLHESLKFSGKELKSKDIVIPGTFGEMTFAKCPNPLDLFINKKEEKFRLSITGEMSIEAVMSMVIISKPTSVTINDNDQFEIWLWK